MSETWIQERLDKIDASDMEKRKIKDAFENKEIERVVAEVTPDGEIRYNNVVTPEGALGDRAVYGGEWGP